MIVNQNIYGLIVPCNFIDEESDSHGEYCAKTKSINIYHVGDLSQKQIGFTIHESFHAMVDRLGIDLDDNTEEILATAVENMMIENYNVEFKRPQIQALNT